VLIVHGRMAISPLTEPGSRAKRRREAGKQEKGEPPFRGSLESEREDYSNSAIEALSFFMAELSSWRIRSAETW